METASAFVLGDVHGQLESVLALLRRTGLLDAEFRWSGGGAALWCVGDYVDRGPHGPETIDLFRRLQEEASAAGGLVEGLLGNHDLLLLASVEFGGFFTANRRRNGGDDADLKRITREQLSWLRHRPALGKVGDTLIAHADSYAYTRYGATVPTVNRSIAALLEQPDANLWDELLWDLSARHAFDDGQSGRVRSIAMLATYGVRRLIHGHTPIPTLLGLPAADVTRPLSYADGRCINVDGGIYLGSPGFLYRVPDPVAISTE